MSSLKRAGEAVQSALMWTPAEKAGLQLHIADTRLAEALRLAQGGADNRIAERSVDNLRSWPPIGLIRRLSGPELAITRPPTPDEARKAQRRWLQGAPAKERVMAFKHTNSKGNEYYLHSRTTPTSSGSRTLYFFSRQQGEGAMDNLPEGYEVSETANGMPVLKKSGGAANTGGTAKASGTGARRSTRKSKAGDSEASSGETASSATGSSGGSRSRRSKASTES